MTADPTVSRLRRLRRFEWARARSRPVKAAAGITVTALCAAYILWQIDVGKTIHILRSASWGYFLGAIAIMGLSVWPMAWRWQRLLRARGIRDDLGWLVRTYFVSYTAGQVLPTSIGGDAARIYETSKRHPGEGAPVTGSVLLERALGGAATLILAAFGLALAVGHYSVGGYLWVELAFVIGSGILGFALFSRRARGPLGRTRPLLARLKLERPLRAAYEGIHGYRDHVGLMVGVMILTLAVQAVRVLSIWLAGRAVGVDLSPRPYYVMGPLLFLVMLIPFTINGLAVREAFFVSFLTQLGVSADRAFATGFLFFVVTIALALPGAAMLAWQSLRPASSTVPDG